MNDFFQQSLFGGMILSVLAYELGLYLKKKFRLALFNPLGNHISSLPFLQSCKC